MAKKSLTVICIHWHWWKFLWARVYDVSRHSSHSLDFFFDKSSSIERARTSCTAKMCFVWSYESEEFVFDFKPTLIECVNNKQIGLCSVSTIRGDIGRASIFVNISRERWDLTWLSRTDIYLLMIYQFANLVGSGCKTNSCVNFDMCKFSQRFFCLNVGNMWRSANLKKELARFATSLSAVL